MSKINDLIQKQIKQAKELEERDRMMDKILYKGGKQEIEWYYEHSETGCPECKESETDFFLGEKDLIEYHRYKCQDPECGYEEIIKQGAGKG